MELMIKIMKTRGIDYDPTVGIEQENQRRKERREAIRRLFTDQEKHLLNNCNKLMSLWANIYINCVLISHGWNPKQSSSNQREA